MEERDPAPSRPTDERTRASSVLPLALELGGDLPCIRCRYNLKGLTIRGSCPECGMPMRATILAVVDPRASELQPIFHPKLTAAGIVIWSVAALAAALIAWFVRMVALVEPGAAVLAPGSWTRLAVPMLVVLSGLGSAVLIRPHDGIPRAGQVMAWVGCVLYLPLAFVMLLFARAAAVAPDAGAWWIAARGDVFGLASVVVDILMMAILILLRPNARMLAARCLLMREGMVDRQTMRAVAFVLSLPALGHLLGILGAALGSAELLSMIGGIFCSIGYLFFLIGLTGIAMDCLRMRRVVGSAPLSLSELLSPARTAASERPSRVWTR